MHSLCLFIRWLGMAPGISRDFFLRHLVPIRKTKSQHLNALILQVFLLQSSSMLSMDVIRGLRNCRALSDSLFRVLFAHFSWLLHHVWASFCYWAPYYSCTWLCLLLDSCWLQSFCTLLHSEFLGWLIHYFPILSASAN